jgi:hypothetical protein
LILYISLSMANKKFDITADSFPVFDGWGPDDFWGSSEWIAWHKLLIEKWGLETANELFVEYYHQASMFAANYNWRTFDPVFIAYAKANGFYDGLFSGVLGGIMKPVSVVGDVATQAVNSISGATGYIQIIMPLLFIGLLLVLAYKGYKFAVS